MFNFKILAFSVIASILGIIGVGLVFSDISRGETAISRSAITAIFFLFCSLVIGYFNDRAWLISVIIAWGSILFGGFLTLAALRNHGSNVFAAQEPPYISAGLVILFLPLILSLLGGYIGSRLKL